MHHDAQWAINREKFSFVLDRQTEHTYVYIYMSRESSSRFYCLSCVSFQYLYNMFLWHVTCLCHIFNIEGLDPPLKSLTSSGHSSSRLWSRGRCWCRQWRCSRSGCTGAGPGDKCSHYYWRNERASRPGCSRFWSSASERSQSWTDISLPRAHNSVIHYTENISIDSMHESDEWGMPAS